LTSVSRVAVLFVAVCFAAAVRVQAQQAAPPDSGNEVVTAPVEIDGTVLFQLRGVSSFPAEMRARLVRDRIVAVAADRNVPVDALRIVDLGNAQTISVGDTVLLGLVEADASLEQVALPALAAAHRYRMRQAIVDHRAARSPGALRRAAINTAIATALLAACIALLIWAWGRLDARLTRRLQDHIHDVGIQSFEVMRGERIRAGLRSVFVFVRTIVLLAGGLIYLGYVLAQWPWTRGMARDIAGFARGLVANIPSLVFLAVLFFLVRLVLRVVRLFFEAVERGTVKLERFDAEWAAPTYKMVRVAIIAFGLIVAYPYIPGSESAAFKGVSLFIGILFSLGSSSAISNIIAGYMMTYRRAFRVGDRVKIGDAMGDVIDMRLQVTHVKSLKNEEIVIPNSQILSSDVVNYSSLAKTHGLILHTEVGIGYETPWRQVEAMLLAAAARCAAPNGQPPRAYVLMRKLGDFAVTYELNMACDDAKSMMSLYTEMHRHILDVFNEYGVQIMTPAYEGDPQQPKVVAPRDWYTAPAGPPDPALAQAAATAPPVPHAAEVKTV
jgi:small-conductance mechanosensitive channel